MWRSPTKSVEPNMAQQGAARHRKSRGDIGVLPGKSPATVPVFKHNRSGSAESTTAPSEPPTPTGERSPSSVHPPTPRSWSAPSPRPFKLSNRCRQPSQKASSRSPLQKTPYRSSASQIPPNQLPSHPARSKISPRSQNAIRPAGSQGPAHSDTAIRKACCGETASPSAPPKRRPSSHPVLLHSTPFKIHHVTEPAVIIHTLPPQTGSHPGHAKLPPFSRHTYVHPSAHKHPSIQSPTVRQPPSKVLPRTQSTHQRPRPQKSRPTAESVFRRLSQVSNAALAAHRTLPSVGLNTSGSAAYQSFQGAPSRAPPMAPPCARSTATPRTLSMAPPCAPSKSPPFAPSMAQPRAPSMAKPRAPSMSPPRAPSMAPPRAPSMAPPRAPSMAPSRAHPGAPFPSIAPFRAPRTSPSAGLNISGSAAYQPSPHAPSKALFRPQPGAPSRAPSLAPPRVPPGTPIRAPSMAPSRSPSQAPSMAPSRAPSMAPSRAPSHAPSIAGIQDPTRALFRTPSRTSARRPSPSRTQSQGSVRGVPSVTNSLRDTRSSPSKIPSPGIRRSPSARSMSPGFRGAAPANSDDSINPFKGRARGRRPTGYPGNLSGAVSPCQPAQACESEEVVPCFKFFTTRADGADCCEEGFTSGVEVSFKKRGCTQSHAPGPNGGAASALEDKDLYIVIGGHLNSNTNKGLAKTQVLEISENKWEKCEEAMPQTRFHFAAAFLDCNIYVVGGYDPQDRRCGAHATKDTFLFEVASQRWEKVCSMLCARSFHTVCVLDGRIYAMGGQDQDEEVQDSVEVYEPESDRWSSLPCMQTCRAGACSAVLKGRVFVVGGYDESGTVLLSTEWFETCANRQSDLYSRRSVNGHGSDAALR
ncbi:uncharacterized protein DKFZp434B061-like isoform X2 [Littorina saxatilis]|uniref:uncharacterized protein DKFZp434B061-like isoform X2 n=1 Tax=Littorina saxatilis TaxID=31220 RepID=UPI0038B68B8E